MSAVTVLTIAMDVVFLVTSFICIVLGVFAHISKKNYEAAIASLNVEKTKVSEENVVKNKKLITMSPKELDDYLGMTFGYFLELNAASYVSERDPDAAIKLYSKCLVDIFEYIGEDGVSALDTYYGQGYLEKWCHVRYSLLENRRVLSRIINRTYQYDAPVPKPEETKKQAVG